MTLNRACMGSLVQDSFNQQQTELSESVQSITAAVSDYVSLNWTELNWVKQLKSTKSFLMSTSIYVSEARQILDLEEQNQWMGM